MTCAQWLIKVPPLNGGKLKSQNTSWLFLSLSLQRLVLVTQKQRSVALQLLKVSLSLQATEAVRVLGQALITRHALPEKAEIDAYHVAIAAVNGIEYLLTWNCTHIANAVTRPKIEATCRALGYEPPIICTPDELMET